MGTGSLAQKTKRVSGPCWRPLGDGVAMRSTRHDGRWRRAPGWSASFTTSTEPTSRAWPTAPTMDSCTRGFIVAMGRDFYDAVVSDPEMAVLDAECEGMCYFFAHLHRERFGEFPERGYGISRGSCSNAIGWAG